MATNQQRAEALQRLLESVHARVRENNADLERIRGLVQEIGIREKFEAKKKKSRNAQAREKRRQQN